MSPEGQKRMSLDRKDAGPTQLVMQKALAEEPAEQPLHKPVLQMEVHSLGIEAPRV